MTWKAIRGLALFFLAISVSPALRGAPIAGRISGVVVDPQGTPQMGATVLVVPEQSIDASPIQLLTNDRGLFLTEGLATGFYSIRATLAGFLPTMEQHVHVSEQHITQLQIELGSVFTSLEKFRRAPNQQTPPQEWTWVLRTSPATRPILRWDEDDDANEVLIANLPSGPEGIGQKTPRSMFELSSGSIQPGSISNLSDAPSTEFAYDESVGGRGDVVFAGHFGYESGNATGGFITEWLPSGNPHTGSVSTVVFHEAEQGSGGPSFHGMKLSRDDQVDLGDRFHLRYGADYLLASYIGTTSSLRPRGELAFQIAPRWIASVDMATHPWQDSNSESTPMESTLDNLDSFPTLLVRSGRPILAGDLHEEFALEHALNSTSSVTASIFHDRSSDTPIFGRGPASSADFLQDFYSNAFAYDGGESRSWGARVAYEQKISDLVSAVVVYAWAGALTPTTESPSESLRDLLATQQRSSLAGRLCTNFARTGTQVSAGYKWVDGRVASRQDAYGEAIYGIDPYVSLIIRQRLPKFIPGHPVVMADFGNLFAQGYLPIETQNGQVLIVPAFRSFRGGLSFQF